MSGPLEGYGIILPVNSRHTKPKMVTRKKSIADRSNRILGSIEDNIVLPSNILELDLAVAQDYALNEAHGRQNGQQ